MCHLMIKCKVGVGQMGELDVQEESKTHACWLQLCSPFQCIQSYYLTDVKGQKSKCWGNRSKLSFLRWNCHSLVIVADGRVLLEQSRGKWQESFLNNKLTKLLRHTMWAGVIITQDAHYISAFFWGKFLS